MADLHEKINAEIENIEKILFEVRKGGDLLKATTIELAGFGALMHNFYNSIENVIKQILMYKEIAIPSGSFWHRDLPGSGKFIANTHTCSENQARTVSCISPFLCSRLRP
jgi:hypothetical protein